MQVPEKVIAELLSTFYRLKVIDYNTMDMLKDELTIRILRRTHRIKK